MAKTRFAKPEHHQAICSSCRCKKPLQQTCRGYCRGEPRNSMGSLTKKCSIVDSERANIQNCWSISETLLFARKLGNCWKLMKIHLHKHVSIRETLLHRNPPLETASESAQPSQATCTTQTTPANSTPLPHSPTYYHTSRQPSGHHHSPTCKPATQPPARAHQTKHLVPPPATQPPRSPTNPPGRQTYTRPPSQPANQPPPPNPPTHTPG